MENKTITLLITPEQIDKMISFYNDNVVDSIDTQDMTQTIMNKYQADATSSN